MRAISRLSLLDGISTSSLAAMMPLRMRVRKSAMGSVIDMRLPTRLRHAGDVALVRELAQADPAQAELAEHGAGAAAAPAARVLPGLVLGRARLAHPLRGLRHLQIPPTRPRPRRRTPPGGPPVRTACRTPRGGRRPPGRSAPSS